MNKMSSTASSNVNLYKCCMVKCQNGRLYLLLGYSGENILELIRAKILKFRKVVNPVFKSECSDFTILFIVR